MALSSLYNRQTQFDILQFDKDLQGKEAFLITHHQMLNTCQIETYDFYYRKIDHFQGTNRIEVLVDGQRLEGDTAVMDVILKNDYDVPFDFNHAEMPVEIYAAFIHKEICQLEKCELFGNQIIPSNGNIKMQLKFKFHEDCICVLCLDNPYNLSLNSQEVKL